VSASSDNTIKVWDPAQPKRCQSTLTHFNDPVWKLHSSDPTLQTFYAGSKSGLLSKLSRNTSSFSAIEADISADVSNDFVDEEWTAIIVCQEDGPVLGVCFIYYVVIDPLDYKL
jgi:WD40 repeat protein